MEVTAKLKNASVGTIKARLVADHVRGKNVNDAIKSLTFMKKKTALMVKKLIESAVANAEQKQVIDVDNLYVKSISVDQGASQKRFRPGSRGKAYVYRRKQSHINLVLDER